MKTYGNSWGLFYTLATFKQLQISKKKLKKMATTVSWMKFDSTRIDEHEKRAYTVFVDEYLSKWKGMKIFISMSPNEKKSSNLPRKIVSVHGLTTRTSNDRSISEKKN